MNPRHYVIRLSGGLGNQMFQYAFGLALAQRLDSLVEFDISFYTSPLDLDVTPRDFELLRVFGLSLPLASSRLISKWADLNPNVLHRIRRRLCGRKQTHLCEHDFGGFGYHPEVWAIPSGYLEGYWQHLAYMAGAEDAIRSAFVFPPPSDPKNSQWLELIDKTESVAIHVRRGDYLSNPGIYQPLTVDYYSEAIDRLRSLTANPVFYVFSDDIPWARENLPVSNAHFVQGNIGNKAFLDMHLMSRCRHIVVANSSFSWWAAFLNSNSGRHVVVPANYAKPGQLAEEQWIRILNGKDVVE